MFTPVTNFIFNKQEDLCGGILCYVLVPSLCGEIFLNVQKIIMHNFFAQHFWMNENDCK